MEGLTAHPHAQALAGQTPTPLASSRERACGKMRPVPSRSAFRSRPESSGLERRCNKHRALIRVFDMRYIGLHELSLPASGCPKGGRPIGRLTSQVPTPLTCLAVVLNQRLAPFWKNPSPHQSERQACHLQLFETAGSRMNGATAKHSGDRIPQPTAA